MDIKISKIASEYSHQLFGGNFYNLPNSIRAASYLLAQKSLIIKDVNPTKYYSLPKLEELGFKTCWEFKNSYIPIGQILAKKMRCNLSYFIDFVIP